MNRFLYVWLLLACSMNLGILTGCDTSNKPSAENLLSKDGAEKEPKTTLIVHLKGKERLWLNYPTLLLKNTSWEFRNAGLNDTTIRREVSIEKVTHVSFRSVSSPNGKFTLIERDFLIAPGDTVELRVKFNDIAFEGKSKGKKFVNEIIALDYRIPSFKLKLHHQDITAFNKHIDSVYVANAESIHAIHKTKQISENERDNLLRFNELLAASEYLSPFTMPATEQEKVDLHKVNYAFAESRLKLASLQSSQFTPTLLSGFAAHRLLAEGRSLEELAVFRTIQQKDLGELYYPFLLQQIAKYPEKNHPVFRQLVDSLGEQMEGTVYAPYLDSMRNIYYRRPVKKGQADFGKMWSVKGLLTEFNQVLEQSKGNVVLVDWWASWCGPCRREMPYLQAIKRQFSGKPIRFIAISIDTDEYADDWLMAAKSENIFDANSYRLKGGNFNPLLKHYGIEEVPRYMVFDKEGNLITEDFVEPTHKSFTERLQAYLLD